MNTKYRERFGFPFILAVRNATKHTILGSIASRVNNQVSAERDECLRQVNKIAWMRLIALITPAPTGFLTCHVLDTARGCPAAGMRIEFFFFFLFFFFFFSFQIKLVKCKELA
jgi:2-oxo-4-hydroxy-4-carboxy-5-ureidoimidazoline decarboxylase